MLDTLKKWTPPESWIKMTSFDIHTGGEPLRIITGGMPELSGDTILARRRAMKDNLDFIRTATMWEPRGHRDMYGCVITSPVTPEADFGVLFLHNQGYSTMCGHAIIGLAKLAVEVEMVKVMEPETVIRIDTPAGLVTAHAEVKRGKIGCVYFHNVPSFVAGLDETVHVPGLGDITYDLAFGGAFYAFVQSKQVGLKCLKEEMFELIRKGMAIKKAIMKKRKINHPYEKDLGFLYGTIFIAPPRNKGVDSRNVCIFADGEVDRSPTGTGVSARMAIHYARGEIDIGESMVIESIVDSRFTGSVVKTTSYGDYEAVIPRIEGTAFISGRHEFFIDPDDPLKYGFILG
jgi:proline racemase